MLGLILLLVFGGLGGGYYTGGYGYGGAGYGGVLGLILIIILIVFLLNGRI
jgi:hypothetical protein